MVLIGKLLKQSLNFWLTISLKNHKISFLLIYLFLLSIWSNFPIEALTRKIVPCGWAGTKYSTAQWCIFVLSLSSLIISNTFSFISHQLFSTETTKYLNIYLLFYSFRIKITKKTTDQTKNIENASNKEYRKYINVQYCSV